MISRERGPSFEDEDQDVGLSDAVVKELRSDWEALDEDIPIPSEKKPRSERDPGEEIAYIERRLKTKRKMLASLQPYERDEKNKLEGEIALLETDLKFFEKKKQRLEEEEKF